MRARHLLTAAPLLLLAACQLPLRNQLPYGPVQEGLTLAYEDPTLPQPQRSQERLQLRVERAKFTSSGLGVVQLDYASLHGTMSLFLRHEDGGIALIAPDGKPLAQVLPKGFPRVRTWQARDTRFEVLGRAAWDGASLLPDTRDPVGYWVEARPAQGPARRTLYLPGLGEVETLERRGSVWVCVNRLVSLGFTDQPTAPNRS